MAHLFQPRFCGRCNRCATGGENTFHANSHREKRNDQAISVFFVWEIASLQLSSYGSWYHSPCGEMKDEKCLSAQCVLELTGIIVY
jgi:hypothetical protein